MFNLRGADSPLQIEKYLGDTESLLSHSDTSLQSQFRMKTSTLLRHAALLIATHILVAAMSIWVWSTLGATLNDTCATHTSNYCTSPIT